jgi:hypothetical protein
MLTRNGLGLALLAVLGVSGIGLHLGGDPTVPSNAVPTFNAPAVSRSQEAWRGRNQALRRALDVQSHMVTTDNHGDSNGPQAVALQAE